MAIGDLHDTTTAAIAANTAACHPGPGIPALSTCQNDLAATAGGDSQVWVTRKDANDSGFGPRVAGNCCGALPWAVAIGDFNGDGINDIAEINLQQDDLSIAYGNASGGYDYGQLISFPFSNSEFVPEPFGLAVGDLGNGHADIAVAVAAYSLDGQPTAGEVALLMNDGQGNFSQTDLPTGTASGSSPVALAIGNLGNGRNDIAVADQGNSGAGGDAGDLDLFMNNGQGGFAQQVIPVGPVAPQSVAIGDLNGDGHPDLVTSNVGSPSTATVFLNKGHGSYSQSSFTVGDYGSTVAVGDLNGDGVDDFAVTAGAYDQGMTVFMTSLNPAGTSPPGISFAQTAVPTGQHPDAIAIGHLNSADGAQDIVLANAVDNDVQVFTNTTPQAPPVVRDSGSALGNPAKVSGLAVKPGDLAVAYVSADGPKTGGQTAFVSGGGLDWTLAARENAQPGDSEVWSARVPGGTPAHITVTATAGAKGYKVALTSVSYSHAYGIGATAAVGGSHAPNATLTTTAGNSWVWAVGTDWLSATARKVGPGQTLLQQDLTASDETYWVQSQTVATAAAGTSVKTNDTAPSTDPYNLVAVEIVP